MFYAFAVIIVIYIVGMLLYQGFQLLKKWREERRNK